MAEKAGRCPLDKRELVQVTISRYWTCPDKPKDRLTAAGTCANGKPRTMVREHRAHGDHNPKHGGLLFMAADKWHHLEAAYPGAGVVRVFVYDNFTQPMSVRDFSGRAVTREEFDQRSESMQERESVPLKRARDGKSFEARIGGRQLPTRFTIKMRFSKGSPEERFDFAFDAYSKEPPSVPAVTRATPAPPARPASPAPLAPPVSLAPPAPPGPVTAQGAASPPVMSGSSGGFDPIALQGTLPTDLAGLTALLAQRDVEVADLVRSGQLGVVYVPAIQAKEVALALEAHASSLPDSRRLEAVNAIKSVVLKAWELDAYGDLGDATKVERAHGGFAAAVKSLLRAYGGR
jgi:hypothetical protein